MREVSRSKKFNKAYEKYLRKHPLFKESVQRALTQLADDPFAPSLNTHKLKGRLSVYFSCNCGFDCRIIFEIRKIDNKEIIVLVDMGIHGDVY